MSLAYRRCVVVLVSALLGTIAQEGRRRDARCAAGIRDDQILSVD